MTVKRYGTGLNGRIEEMECGAFTGYAEYSELLKERDALAAENAALKEQSPDVRSACMFEAIEKAEKFMDEGMPELAMVEAFEILKMKRTPVTDAAIASIHADGIENFGDELLSDLRGDCWDGHDIKYIEMQITNHLEKLRKEYAHD